jgi:Xaa-Pro aminopeptidase
MDHAGRLRRLQQNLGREFDALLISHLPNIRYLSGFTGSSAILLVTKTSATFFTDGRYTTQARTEVKAARVVIARKSPLLATAQWIGGKFSRPTSFTIGVEGEHFTVAMHRQFQEALPPNIRLDEAPPWTEQMRMLKDPEELLCLKNSVLLGASLFDVALKTIRPGVKEADVAAEIEYAARARGAETMSFETIIASGKRSALPHGRASQAAIPTGAFVVCDFGVILAGYCSDMTRTVFVGRPSRSARELYKAVQEAQEAAVNAVRPGITVGEVDRAARKLLRGHRLARYFTHSTGHGVGLGIHEAPRVAAGESEVLHPGAVITIEPGVYIPGKWGVRIEDMVVVTETGSVVLTPTSRDLIAI